jgi:hypothetical protein
MSDDFRIKVTAGEVSDELQAGGDLDFGPDTKLRAVAVIVAVDHGDQSTVHYRFKDAVGDDADLSVGLQILGLTLLSIGQGGGTNQV